MQKISVRHVLSALILVVFILALGGTTLWHLGDGEWGLGESLYFALVTVATVGYSEMPHLAAHPGARLVTAGLIACGVVSFALFQGTLTAMLVQGVLRSVFRRKMMDGQISRLSGHYVVAGAGRIGRYVIDELLASRTPFVLIDQDETLLASLATEQAGLLYVVGDATHDATLKAAGVERARGFVAALGEDTDNLFVTLSVRTLNPEAKVVTKAGDVANEPKMLRAGASAVVSPHRIGGMRMASELIRPRVTEFLDQMLRLTGRELRFEEVVVPANSPWRDKSLREVPIRTETQLLVVALHEPEGNYVYNPASEHRLRAGASLIVIGEHEGIAKLSRLMAAG